MVHLNILKHRARVGKTSVQLPTELAIDSTRTVALPGLEAATGCWFQANS